MRDAWRVGRSVGWPGLRLTSRITTRNLAVMVVFVLLCVGASACGGTGGGTSSNQTRSNATEASRVASSKTRAAAARPKVEKDHDGDGDAHGDPALFDNDDFVTHFGHAASASSRQEIGTLIRAYYRAGARHDGATACTLIDAKLAEVFSQQYSESSGGSAQAGTCAAVMTRLFKHSFQWSTAQVADLLVAAVRVRGDSGEGLIRINSDARQIFLERESGAWKIAALFDSEVR